MDAAFNLSARLLELVLAPFDALPRALALTLIALLTGVAMLALVRFTTPQARVSRARDRMMSAVYETRLFPESPRRLFLAQARLLGWGLLYVALLSPALVLMALPLALAYRHLDARFGQAPLALRSPLVLEAELSPGSDPRSVGLELPQGVTATLPGVRTQQPPRVFFRFQIERPGRYDAELRLGQLSVKKLLVAMPGQPSSVERARGLRHVLAPGIEPALPSAGPFERVVVFHEEESERWLGLSWWVYWLLLATLSALVLRKPLGVTL